MIGIIMLGTMMTIGMIMAFMYYDQRNTSEYGASRHGIGNPQKEKEDYIREISGRIESGWYTMAHLRLGSRKYSSKNLPLDQWRAAVAVHSSAIRKKIQIAVFSDTSSQIDVKEIDVKDDDAKNKVIDALVGDGRRIQSMIKEMNDLYDLDNLLKNYDNTK